MLYIATQTRTQHTHKAHIHTQISTAKKSCDCVSYFVASCKSKVCLSCENIIGPPLRPHYCFLPQQYFVVYRPQNTRLSQRGISSSDRITLLPYTYHNSFYVEAQSFPMSCFYSDDNCPCHEEYALDTGVTIILSFLSVSNER